MAVALADAGVGRVGLSAALMTGAIAVHCRGIAEMREEDTRSVGNEAFAREIDRPCTDLPS